MYDAVAHPFRIAVAFLAIATPVVLAAQTPLAPQQILAASDKVRNPVPAFRVRNSVIEYRSGRQVSVVDLDIASKLNPATRQYRNLIRYVAPARDRGKIMLMDGQLLWFFDPASAATVRISPQQRLSGQVSNGDVLTANLAEDYNAVSADPQNVVDAEKATRNAWHLSLQARTPRALYGRIEYWIDRQSFVPIKGIFYADSGRMLKIAYFRKYAPALGGIRPSEVIVLDAIDRNLVTKMVFGDFQRQDTPASWFQKDYLSQLGTR